VNQGPRGNGLMKKKLKVENPFKDQGQGQTKISDLKKLKVENLVTLSL
jgi:hypothetical protein